MYRNPVHAICVLFLCGLLTPAVHARGGMVLYGALTSGGDTLISASSEDGYDIDLKAGGLFHFGLGYEHRSETGGARITLGYKFDTLDADNGDADMTRLPLEIVMYGIFAERHNLGGGLVYEMSPRYKQSIDGLGSLNIDFDDATGYMLYYGYSSSSYLEWGFRFTDIDYETGPVSIDGGSVGLYVSFLP